MERCQETTQGELKQGNTLTEQLSISFDCFSWSLRLHMCTAMIQNRKLSVQNELQSVSRLKAQQTLLLAKCIHIIYSFFASAFIIIAMVTSLFNNPEYDYGNRRNCLLG